MADFTRVGCAIWQWDPWLKLDSMTRMFWLGIYTTPEAKRIVPGLWHGGIGTMAEAMSISSDDVLKSLDQLLEHGLAEYDQRTRLLRLTRLPDAGERPMNGRAIKGWWNKFTTLPASRLRDSHVSLLWWLLETSGYSGDHLAAWNDTFAKIVIPKEPARAQRLIDSDTGTVTQPSLFSARNERNQVSDNTIPNSIRIGIRTGIGINSSLLADPESIAAGREHDHHTTPVPEQATEQGSDGVPVQCTVQDSKPHLELVPPYSPQQLVDALSEGSGGWWPAELAESSGAALRATISDLDARGVGLDKVPAAGKWWRMRNPQVPPGAERRHYLSEWASTPGMVQYAVRAWEQHQESVAEHQRVADERAAMLVEAKQALWGTK